MTPEQDEAHTQAFQEAMQSQLKATNSLIAAQLVDCNNRLKETSMDAEQRIAIVVQNARHMLCSYAAQLHISMTGQKPSPDELALLMVSSTGAIPAIMDGLDETAH
jgi:hypothetical protein